MGPAEICKNRLEARNRDQEHWKKRHRWLGNARLVGAVAGVAFLWSVETYAPAFTWYAVAALAAAFLATARMFARFEDAMTYAEHAARLYEIPVLGDNRKDRSGQSVEALEFHADHPYARDVDILEPGGLLDYLNISSTREGTIRLLELLTEPASSDAISKRQEAVKELKSQLDLRERFFVAGSRRIPYVRTELMRQWAEQDPVHVPSWVPAACAIASCAVLAAVALVVFNPSPSTYALLAACILAEFAVWKSSRRISDIKIMLAERIHLDFRELRELVRILEVQDFHASNLQGLSASLRGTGEPASRAIGSFCRVISLFEARRNQIVALVGPLVLYQTQLALAMERWKAKHGSKVGGWIDAIGRFEAYSSLACFAFEHPFYAFPRVANEGPVLRATDLAHPLLPDDAVVGNDVSLDRQCPVLVVSGANMAGKSTLLRTIGINVALAYAGSPVRARSLEMSPASLIASIRVNDSLQQGLSRFAAELVRIRCMLDIIGTGTSTIVLIDELFAGTNSFDRFVGAVALAEFLLGCDTSLAVLSTHDRNVTQWAEQNPTRIANMHFRDVFEGERMHFDYRLHDGPALRGNAIDLMKLAGLPIPKKLPTPNG